MDTIVAKAALFVLPMVGPKSKGLKTAIDA